MKKFYLFSSIYLPTGESFMKKKKSLYIPIIITLFLLCCLTAGVWLFAHAVGKELWMNSIQTVTETTRQKANAIQTMLDDDFASLTLIQEYLKDTVPNDLENLIRSCRSVDPDIFFYLPEQTAWNNTVEPFPDQDAADFLNKTDLSQGLINSHVNLATGKNVFDIFQQAALADGSGLFLLKEYRTSEIAHHFPLTFYDFTGYSYLVNRDGTIMVRPQRPGGAMDAVNLLDLISAEENHPQAIEMFKNSLGDHSPGWVRFTAGGNDTVFCYEPLPSNSQWLLVSVFPAEVINRQKASILEKTMLFSGALVLIILIITAVFSGSRRAEEKAHTRELKKALAAADAANKAKGQFLMNMSHDIRTPLNAIIGMTTVAKEYVNDKYRTADCLEKINISGKHLLSLVNDIMDMSQIENGAMILQEGTLRISRLYQEVVDLMSYLAKDSQVTLESEFLPPQNDIVSGDALRIRQVLINVIGNAVKYTPPGGRVSLHFSQDGPVLDDFAAYRFCCTDTGIGMEPEFLKKMFYSFERSRNTTSSGIAGMGIGLTIAKGLLDLMGGTISAESEAGKGSSFTVEFRLRALSQPPEEENSVSGPSEQPSTDTGDGPKAVVAADSSPSTDTDAGPKAIAVPDSPSIAAANPEPEQDTPVPDAPEVFDYTKKRVLLVEDVELNMEIAEAILGITGIQIEKAYDGLQAVRMVQSNPRGYYDLIFMDIQMPVMDGYEATRQIRGMDREDAWRIPILALSANALAQDVENSKKAGMDGHLAKPIDIDLLQQTLRRYCAG